MASVVVLTQSQSATTTIPLSRVCESHLGVDEHRTSLDVVVYQ